MTVPVPSAEERAEQIASLPSSSISRAKHVLGSEWPQGQALWVFGYGSIIYRVDFPVEAQVFGQIRNQRRAFLQESHDHRGTEENPGRVCTLVAEAEWNSIFPPSSDAKRISNNNIPGAGIGCWGMAYKVKSGMEQQVKAHLDHREKDGYSIDFVDVFASQNAAEPVLRNVMVYVGVKTNPSFTRAPSLEATAAVIARAVGPSGTNREYLYRLCDALRTHHPDAMDAYLLQLEAMVRALGE
ncbi:hypothetical protein GGI11_003624 [Coemansia sp. RSA 2049]|nr:hypothetical protein GGI11_003624 [Coemansia sp. RSA 2049]